MRCKIQGFRELLRRRETKIERRLCRGDVDQTQTRENAYETARAILS